MGCGDPASGRADVRLVLDVAEADAPIRGTIFSGSGSAERFYGWIELASRLEGIRTRARGAERLSAGAA